VPSYSLFDASGAPVYGPGWFANSDHDAQLIAQRASSLLNKFTVLVTPTANPLYPPTGAPPDPASFTPTVVYRYRPSGGAPVGAGASFSATMQAAISTATPAQAIEGASLLASYQAAASNYDQGAADGVANSSLYAGQIQAWVRTAAPAWAEVDRLARYVTGQAGAVPFDPTLQNLATLTARISAATAAAAGQATAPALSLASSGWDAALAQQYPPNASADAKTTVLAGTLAAAQAACQAWISSLGFR
jgi:hypothetical protein